MCVCGCVYFFSKTKQVNIDSWQCHFSSTLIEEMSCVVLLAFSPWKHDDYTWLFRSGDGSLPWNISFWWTQESLLIFSYFLFVVVAILRMMASRLLKCQSWNEVFHSVFLRCLYNFMKFYHIDSYNWTAVQFKNSVSKGTCDPMDCM